MTITNIDPNFPKCRLLCVYWLSTLEAIFLWVSMQKSKCLQLKVVSRKHCFQKRATLYAQEFMPSTHGDKKLLSEYLDFLFPKRT